MLGADAEQLFAVFKERQMGLPELFERIRANEERYGQYRVEMQFILKDKKMRTFRAEHVRYGGRGWFPIGFYESLSELVKELIPLLGTEGAHLFY